MTEELAEVLHHLLWVWETYGACEHRCMQAGEQAMDLLQKHGLVEDEGWWLSITPAGRALMERDFTGWNVPPAPDTPAVP